MGDDNTVLFEQNMDVDKNFSKAVEPTEKIPYNRRFSKIIDEEYFSKEAGQNNNSVALGFFSGNEYELAGMIASCPIYKDKEETIRDKTFFASCKSSKKWHPDNINKLLQNIGIVLGIMKYLLSDANLKDEIISKFLVEKIVADLDRLKKKMDDLKTNGNPTKLNVYKEVSNIVRASHISAVTRWKITDWFDASCFCNIYLKIIKIMYKFNSFALNKKVKGSMGSLTFASGINSNDRFSKYKSYGINKTLEKDDANKNITLVEPEKRKYGLYKSDSESTNISKYLYISADCLDMLLPIKLIPDICISCDDSTRAFLIENYSYVFDYARKLSFFFRSPLNSFFSKVCLVDLSGYNNDAIAKRLNIKGFKSNEDTEIKYKFVRTQAKRNYQALAVAASLTERIYCGYAVGIKQDLTLNLSPMNITNVPLHDDHAALKTILANKRAELGI